jgi:hypothetical protein
MVQFENENAPGAYLVLFVVYFYDGGMLFMGMPFFASITVNCQLSTVIKDFSDFWLITALRTVFLRDVAASRHSSNKFGSALGKNVAPIRSRRRLSQRYSYHTPLG